MSDRVNHPFHYSSGSKCECGKMIECLDVVRNTDFNIGNIIKYVWRHKHKNGVEDLKKARFYLDDEIKKYEGEK